MLLRILHVIPTLDVRYGGPSYAVLAMVRFQNEVGIKAEIVTTHKKQVESEKLKVRGGKENVISEQSWQIFSFPSSLGEYKFSLGLWLWLKENIQNYDVVHIHSVFCFSTVAAALIAKRAGVPYVLRPLGQLYPWALKNKNSFIKYIYLSFVENRTIRNAAAIHFTAQDEMDRCGIAIDRGKAYVLPLGVEAPREEVVKEAAYVEYPYLQNNKVLLFLSRIHPKKGLDLVLPWLAPILHERPDWVVAIAGETENAEYFASLQTQIINLGISKKIFFVGNVLGQRKSALFAIADVFLLPSHSENFGIAVVEAMAASIPVLISDQVAIHNEVADSCSGLVFRLEQDSFSKAVCQMMDHEEDRVVMGRRGVGLVRTKFDWTKITEKQIDCYKQILDKNPKTVNRSLLI